MFGKDVVLSSVGRSLFGIDGDSPGGVGNSLDTADGVWSGGAVGVESLEFGATMRSPADAVNKERSFPSLAPAEGLAGASELDCVERSSVIG